MRFKLALLAIRDLLLWLIDTLFCLTSARGGKFDKKRLLFIRLDAIGDFIVWLDSARILREYYKDYHITFIGNAVYDDLAKNLPLFDEVFPVNPQKLRKKLSYRFQVFRKIREKYFEKVIHFPYTRSNYYLDGEAIVHIACSREKIGSLGESTDNWRKKISDRFYNRLLTTDTKPMVELERNAEFLSGLGIKDYQPKVFRFPEKILDSPLPSSHHDYIIFPGAGSPKRQWPVELFAKLAEQIYNKTGWRGVICGGTGEERLANQLIEKSNVPLQSLAGQTTILELIGLIANTRIVIGNETGAIHIAAAVGTPSVCLLGGGHYGRFVPYKVETLEKYDNCPITVTHPMPCFNCNWMCIFETGNGQPVPCLLNIDLNTVWNVVEKVINQINKS